MNRPKFTPPPTIPRSSEPRPEPDPAKVMDFLKGADRNSAPDVASPAPAVTKPVSKAKSVTWQDLDDETRSAAFNMRFTKLEKACLEYIDKKTPHSQHSFIVSVLRPALAAKMKELTGEEIESLLRGEDEA